MEKQSKFEEQKSQFCETGRYSFLMFIEPDDEYSIAKMMEYISEFISPHGIRIELGPTRVQKRKGLIKEELIVHVDNGKISRNAGRHRKNPTYTLEVIESMIEHGDKPSDIASQMGIGQSTFYRRLRIATKKKTDGAAPSEIMV